MSANEPTSGPKVKRSELVSALSYALDISEGHPTGHGVRCCWIGSQVGREIGLPADDLGNLYYTLLLKDVGCSSNAARICELYLADDIALKHDFKLIDDSVPQILAFVLSRTGVKAKFADRVRAVMNIARNGGEIARQLFETRCQVGGDIVRMMRFPDEVARGIRDLDEHWDGGGRPARLKGEEISVLGRIALLSQIADVFHASAGAEAALSELRARSGKWFDPALVAACEQASRKPGFWEALAGDRIDEAISDLAPDEEHQVVDDDYLDEIAAAFAKVVDAKSPFTRGHSERVALFADVIATELDFPDEARRRLRRAALLHDVGKLGVSNEILDKPAKLNAAEFDVVRHHPVLGAEILARISAMGELTRIALSHHERLDGRGYPHGLSGQEIDIETRIVTAADIFDALTADRPYRKAMPVDQALGIIAGDVGTAVDRDCFAGLRSGLLRAFGPERLIPAGYSAASRAA